MRKSNHHKLIIDHASAGMLEMYIVAGQIKSLLYDLKSNGANITENDILSMEHLRETIKIIEGEIFRP